MTKGSANREPGGVEETMDMKQYLGEVEGRKRGDVAAEYP
jgi:hypothetical protein